MAQRPNFYDRIAALRQKRIERRAGKALIHEEAEILGYIDQNKVPVMIQHCVLKVMKKMPGDEKDKFISAFNICSATFSRYDYTRSASMQMTGKGLKRNRRHQREKEASGKKSRYNGLVRKLWAAAIKKMKETRSRRETSEERAVDTEAKKRREAIAKGKPKASLIEESRPAAPKRNMDSRRTSRQKRK